MLYLLRVGVDLTYGGFHSPIFRNLSYLFIPIPDNNVIKERSITYSEYKWNNKSILPYIPKNLREEFSSNTIHNDPEFITFTYGSPKFHSKGTIEKNYKKLKNTKTNDLLIFYAGFSDAFGEGNDLISGLYFFAYFVVDQIIKYSTFGSFREDLKNLISGNHHYIHEWNNQVIVVSDRENSRVFEKAVLLSSKKYDRKGNNYYPCEEIKNILGGYNRALNRSSLREFNQFSMQKEFKKYLDNKSTKFNF